MKVDGKVLMLRLGGKTVALATSCALEETLETFDARTKDDEGAVDAPGAITGNLTTDSLLGMNKENIQHTYATLSSLFRAKQPIDVEVFLAANAAESMPAAGWTNGPVKKKGFVGHTGRALIKSLRLSGEVAGKAKISVQLGVQGELSPTLQPELESSVAGNILDLKGNIEVSKGVLDLSDYELFEPDNTLEL